MRVAIGTLRIATPSSSKSFLPSPPSRYSGTSPLHHREIAPSRSSHLVWRGHLSTTKTDTMTLPSGQAAHVASSSATRSTEDASRANEEERMGTEPLPGGLPSSEAPWQIVRGRTTRRRSSATETYVCVLAWIVRVPGEAQHVESLHKDDTGANGATNGAGSSTAILDTTPDDARQMLGHVQDVRRRFDAAYSRWEPHVTLIPPFLVPFRRTGGGAPRRSGTMENEAAQPAQKDEDDGSGEHSGSPSSSADNDDQDKLAELQTSRSSHQGDPFDDLTTISQRIEAICAQENLNNAGDAQGAQPKVISFDRIDQFALRRYKTVHLRPKAAGPGTKALRALQGKLAYALPEAFENSRNAATRKAAFRASGSVQEETKQQYTAHLTLGQAGNKSKEAELCEALKVFGSLPAPGDAQAATTLPDRPMHMASPLVVPIEAIQLLYKPVKRSGPYDVYREFRMG